MKVVVDRTFGFEIYFIVNKWRAAYRHFNLLFCNVSRPLSLVINTEGPNG